MKSYFLPGPGLLNHLQGTSDTVPIVWETVFWARCQDGGNLMANQTPTTPHPPLITCHVLGVLFPKTAPHCSVSPIPVPCCFSYGVFTLSLILGCPWDLL